jgi:hypothetical protein
MIPLIQGCHSLVAICGSCGVRCALLLLAMEANATRREWAHAPKEIMMSYSLKSRKPFNFGALAFHATIKNPSSSSELF